MAPRWGTLAGHVDLYRRSVPDEGPLDVACRKGAELLERPAALHEVPVSAIGEWCLSTPARLRERGDGHRGEGHQREMSRVYFN